MRPCPLLVRPEMPLRAAALLAFQWALRRFLVRCLFTGISIRQATPQALSQVLGVLRGSVRLSPLASGCGRRSVTSPPGPSLAARAEHIVLVNARTRLPRDSLSEDWD